MRFIILFALFILTVSSFDLTKLSSVQSQLLGRICKDAGDPLNPTHLPHPTDCRKFYKCDNGVLVIQRCPAGLWWSSAADWCDYPEKSDCGNPGGNIPSTEAPESDESDSSNSDSSESNSSESVSEEVEASPELPDGCPADEDPLNPTHLPHPTDCRKFYKCNHGVPVIHRCPAGLWWSSAADWCDYPEKSDCGNPGGNIPSTETPKSDESDSSKSDSSESNSSESASEEVEATPELPDGCPADEDPLNPTHLPHPTDCRKFYKCNHGVPVIQRCPAGLWWSSAADWCDYPEKSDCGNPGGNIPSTETPESDESDSSNSDSSESNSSESASEEVEASPELPDGCPADEDPLNPTHLPHPTDCRKFYKCNHGVPVIKRCPAGLWWSSAADWCDYPEKSDCGNPGGNIPSTEAPESDESDSSNSDSSESNSSESASEEVEASPELPDGCPADEDPLNPTHLPHPTDCRKFYKCNHGVPVIQRCPAGLWWSSAADWCDYPEKSDCGNPGGNIPSTETPESDESDSSNSDSSESNSSESASEEVEASPELPDGCPADEDPLNPTHLPHPTDCRKFYKCNHGVPVIQRCPAGLWWSSAADWCDYPEKSDCGNPGGNIPSTEAPESDESDSSNSDSSESNSSESASEEVEASPELPDGCPADEDPLNPTHLPHPTDCRKFYKCNHGVPVIQRCPAGLWWSSAADWCDYPEKSDCGNPGGNIPSTEAPESDESDSSNSDSNESNSSESASEEVESSPELPDGCPADEDPLNPTHLPHPTDCRKFYKCNHGVPVIQRCPAGLWWSSAADWCDYPEKSDCGNPGGNIPSTETPESDESDSSNSDSSESNSSESASEEVEASPELPDGCPADEDPLNPTHLPHPTDCRKFYKCNHGVPVIQRCPAGLWWSSAADWCDYPEKSDCGNPGGNIPSTETPESDESDSSNSDSSESNSSESASEEVEASPELPDGCPADEDPLNPTHLPHPTDCRKFYKCNHGVPVIQRCPAGLWWSSAADWCDYPEKSDCGNPGGNIPSTETPESDESDSSNSDSSESNSSESASEEVEASPELPDGCPADEDPLNPTHLPHLTDCRKFYKCNHGVPVIHRCPAGLWWSSAADWCDYPEKSDCGNPGGNIPSTEAPESDESDSSNSDSSESNSSESASEEVESSPELPDGCPADEDPLNPTHLPHPTDCRKFYKCNHGVPVIQRCPAGLWWSSAADWCDYPEKSDCGNPGGNIPSTETPESDESDSSNSDSSESNSSESASEEVEASPELPDGCPADEDPLNPTHLPHPTDCRKFYKCNHGVPVIQRCPAGLWWSSAADWCDYPEKSDCGNPGGNIPSTETPESDESDSSNSDSSESNSSESASEEVEASPELPDGCPANEDPLNPTHLPHPTDCRKFYKCNHGVPVIQRCPAGLWWSSAADWCDYPEKSDCGNPGGNIPSTETPESDESDSSNSDSSESNSSESGSEEVEASPELPDGCPADEDPLNPTHLPHPTDCRKFYKCNHGVPVIQRCPAGLWWSSAADWCDYFEKSDCGNPGGNIPSTEAPESNESSSNEAVEAPSQLPERCPIHENSRNPTHLPYPTDCRKFYKCDHGVPVIQRCPAGLWWSSAANYCDYPEKSDCATP